MYKFYVRVIFTFLVLCFLKYVSFTLSTAENDTPFPQKGIFETVLIEIRINWL